MGSELYLRRNFIFWGLFVLDKGLSLSFGRPPMLPAYLYQNVPPPDPKHMVKLRPHLKSTPNDVIDDFGCFFILTFRELAIIQGKIGESMHRKEDARTSVKLREDLEMWMARLKEQVEASRALTFMRRILTYPALQVGGCPRNAA
jgi:hypothetical protein